MIDSLNKKEAPDIVIVGGGMVGASLALMLAEALPDAHISVLESKAYQVDADDALDKGSPATGSGLASFDGRSTALAPTTVQTMRALGVWPALIPYATAIDTIHVSDKGHFGKATFTPADNEGQPLGYVVENRGLGKGLVGAVQKHERITVMAPVSVERIRPLQQGAECVFNDANRVQAKLVIVADGADSPLRTSLGIQESVTQYRQIAMVANVTTEYPHKAVAYERFTVDGPLAFLPLDGPSGRRCAVVCTLPEHQQTWVTESSDEDCLEFLQTRFGHRLGKLKAIGKRVTYPLSLRVAQEQVRSNMVLMGNAAHFLHPVAGQGFNLALRDGLRLVDTLKHVSLSDIGQLSVLQTYEQAQQRDQDRTIALSNTFNTVFKQPFSVVALLRNLGLAAVEHQPWVRSQFIAQLSGRAEKQSRVFS